MKGELRTPMAKHPDCQEVCQQADEYGVWPERSCSPVCVWLGRDDLETMTTRELLKRTQRGEKWVPAFLADASPSTLKENNRG